MATLGDPLVDLGTLLNYWPDPSDGPDSAMAVPGPGAARPARRAPRSSTATATAAAATSVDIDWYEAYGCWKTIVILQQLYARYLRGRDRRTSAWASAASRSWA